jgi:hypothetical protein
VRDAIVAVLGQASGDLRVRDIHRQVEQLLNEPVPDSSVKDCLRRGCRKDPPLFEYVGMRRGYRLPSRSRSARDHASSSPSVGEYDACPIVDGDVARSTRGVRFGAGRSIDWSKEPGRKDDPNRTAAPCRTVS